MKHSLFTWNDIDEDAEDSRDFFEDIVLLKQIGKFPPGTRFDAATIWYKGDEDSDYTPYLYLINFVDGVHGTRKPLFFGKYSLDLSVKDVIDEPQ